jgi:hypothetical protein
MSQPALHCPNCDYNLTGLTENRCPECGSEFDLDELRDIAYPKATPIANMDLAYQLLFQPAIETVLALLLALLGSVYLGGPIPILLCALLLLAHLYFKTESLVPRLLANMSSDKDGDHNHKRRSFVLRWGMPLLFLFQVVVVVGTVLLIFEFVVPPLY